MKKNLILAKSISVFFLALIVFLLLVFSTGCTQANHVSVNVSKEADNFNVIRRLTVINTRSDSEAMKARKKAMKAYEEQK